MAGLFDTDSLLLLRKDYLVVAVLAHTLVDSAHTVAAEMVDIVDSAHTVAAGMVGTLVESARTVAAEVVAQTVAEVVAHTVAEVVAHTVAEVVAHTVAEVDILAEFVVSRHTVVVWPGSAMDNPPLLVQRR